MVEKDGEPAAPPEQSEGGGNHDEHAEASEDKPRSSRFKKRHLFWIVPVVFLLLENVFLWTPALPSLIQMAPPVRLSYGFAYTIIPGKVTVYDYHMTVSDRVVQMQLDVERATVDFNFFTMPSKKIHLSGLKASGARMRLRPVMTEEQAKAPWVQYSPPIEGIPMPPIWRHPERPKLPTEKLWKVRLDDIDAEFEELWIGPVRVEGQGHLKGGFELHPRTLVEVMETRLTWGKRDGVTAPGDQNEKGSSVTFGLGEEQLSPDAFLDLRVEIPPFQFKGSTPFLDAVQGNLDLRMAFENLQALSGVLPSQDVAIGRAVGLFELHAGLAKGRLDDDSSFQLSAPKAELVVPALDPPLVLAGALNVDASVQGSGEAQKAESKLEWKNLSVDLKEETPPGPELERLFARADFDLASSLPDSSFAGGELRVEGFQASDLRFFNPMLEKTPVQLTSGHGRLQAQVTADKDLRADGYVEVHAINVGLRAEDIAVQFSSTLKAEIGQDPKTETLRFQPVTLQVKPFTLQSGGQTVPWSFVASTQHTTIDTETGRKLSILALTGPSLKPVLEPLVKNGFLEWAGKLVLGEGDTEAKLRFEQLKNQMRLDVLAFKSGRVAVDGVLMAKGKELKGAFLIMDPVLRIGVRLPKDKARVHPTASRDWLERELAEQGIPPIQHQRVKPGHQDEADKADAADKRDEANTRREADTRDEAHKSDAADKADASDRKSRTKRSKN